jgi:glucose-1-phosphate cytidylyltransferase
MTQTIPETPVFILAGGLGTRIKEETQFRPKPMVPIGNHPILWHIMRWYAKFGFRRFILCLGFRADVIKEYFHSYHAMNSDFTVDLASNEMTIHSVDHSQDWEVTLAYTGEHSMTGARIGRAAERFLGDAEHAAVTYGDGLCNVDLAKEFAFHNNHGACGTILGANPPSRFGELKMEDDQVIAFEEKPELSNNWINGGYFFFKRDFFSEYVSTDEGCILEKDPLIKLAKDRQLNMYRHSGFWQCMDTQRDRDHLTKMWESGSAPWMPELPAHPGPKFGKMALQQESS